MQEALKLLAAPALFIGGGVVMLALGRLTELPAVSWTGGGLVLIGLVWGIYVAFLHDK